MTSKKHKDKLQLDGIFSTDPSQSPLFDANHVFIKYCSSDAWIGETTLWGWNFNGQAIVKAAINYLINE